jgi:hypothetical protein
MEESKKPKHRPEPKAIRVTRRNQKSTRRRTKAVAAKTLKAEAESERGAKFVSKFIHEGRAVDVSRLAAWFGMSPVQLGRTVGYLPGLPGYATSRPIQYRIREMLEIIGRVVDWAGGPDQAMAWYRAEPLPAFGGRTAESLVKTGKAAAVRDYLDHVALGGFA